MKIARYLLSYETPGNIITPKLSLTIDNLWLDYQQWFWNDTDIQEIWDQEQKQLYIYHGLADIYRPF